MIMQRKSTKGTSQLQKPQSDSAMLKRNQAETTHGFLHAPALMIVMVIQVRRKEKHRDTLNEKAVKKTLKREYV